MAFEAMKDAAARLGWKLSPADPGLLDVYTDVTLTGAEGDVPIILCRRASTYAFVTTGFFRPALTPAFVITTEGVTGAIAHALGMHDIEVGDRAFDQKFRIASKDPAAVERLFTAEVKAALFQLAAKTNVAFNGFRVTEGAVSVERAYMTNLITPDDIVSDIPLVTATIRALRAAAATNATT